MTTDDWIVDWQVTVDGKDVTDQMRPYLIDITVTDQDGQASDSCSITLDDEGGQLKLPRVGQMVEVAAKGAQLFGGPIESVRSNGNRSGGRVLRVSAKGFDTQGKAKEPQRLYRDDATLDDFLSAIGDHAGLTMNVDPALANINRPYWGVDGESCVQVCQRLAHEMDATFKIRGTQAVFKARGAPSGLQAVSAVYGENVMSWSIAPLMGRPKHKATKSRFFDRPSGQHQTVTLALDQDAEADMATRAPLADQGQADDVNAGRASKSKREGGDGSIEMLLMPEAQAEAPLVLSGARPGVDGSYVIASATHKGSRSGGSGTNVQVKQPEDGAGKDDR